MDRPGTLPFKYFHIPSPNQYTDRNLNFQKYTTMESEVMEPVHLQNLKNHPFTVYLTSC